LEIIIIAHWSVIKLGPAPGPLISLKDIAKWWKFAGTSLILNYFSP
jgi:hypothetical protein